MRTLAPRDPRIGDINRAVKRQESRAMAVRGVPVTVTAAPGWLSGYVPLDGVAAELLARQAAIPGLAKLACGPTLQADVPVDIFVEDTEGILCEALEQGLDILTGREAMPCVSHADAGDLLESLVQHLSASPWTWERGERGLDLKVDVGVGMQTIACESASSCVRLHSTLVRLPGRKPITEEALTHFALAFNAGLRLVRAGLNEDAVVLEVAIPSSRFSLRFFERALEALVAGARLAKRECLALRDDDLAQAYVTLINQRR